MDPTSIPGSSEIPTTSAASSNWRDAIYKCVDCALHLNGQADPKLLACFHPICSECFDARKQVAGTNGIFF